MYDSKNNYETKPGIRISENADSIWIGETGLSELLRDQISQGKQLIVIDLYPGVKKQRLLHLLEQYHPDIIDTDSCKKTDQQLLDLFEANITEDRVFGYLSEESLSACFDPHLIAAKRRQLQEQPGRLTFVIGVGASLITKGDLCLFFDVTRWEIQRRFRNGEPNWLVQNQDAPILTKFKIGYFIEWRLADRHKFLHASDFDYWVDSTDTDCLKIMEKNTFYDCFQKLTTQPFRLEPYFDESVWGGQWMKQMFQLDPDIENYGWSFDGVPEENNVNFRFGDVTVSFPCMNLVQLFPEKLLGFENFKRFGAEFPIRFDMLDTFEGGNLSLQVHPTTEYVKQNFGISYTQDESYYILDAAEDSCVYLGLKQGISREQMLAELEAADRGEIQFDADKYVNKIPVKKHDHILIPAGTIHCSGRNTQVLEISATPYIFTFKLWDWGQVGLDGLPRPVHIEHGRKNIQWNRDTDWVRQNLVSRFTCLHQNEQYEQYRTGLHELEFIETHVYQIKELAPVSSKYGVSVMNLVDGSHAVIESADDRFAPYTLHYGETCIMPAAAGDYRIRRPDGTDEIKIICAHVRL